MKEISLGKVVFFRISMDKIQASKRNQNQIKVVSFGGSIESPAPSTPNFGSFSFSPRPLADYPTVSASPRLQSSNDFRLSNVFFIKNPQFPGLAETSWSLRYRMDSISNEAIVDIFPTTTAGFDVEYLMSLCAEDGRSLETSNLMVKKGTDTSPHTNFTSGFHLSMATLTAETDKYFWDKGHLVIKVHVFSRQPEASSSDQTVKNEMSSNSKFNKMLEDLKEMFDTMKGSDVVIEGVDGVKLNAHKAFLMARSSTFDKMFATEMTEKETGNVMVKDFDSIVLAELLRFIYYNEVVNMEEVDTDLFKAAMRYEVKELPEMCLRSIVDNIHKKDILEVIELADIYGLTELFKSSVNIFMANFKMHETSEIWAKLDGSFKMKILTCVADIHYSSSMATITG